MSWRKTKYDHPVLWPRKAFWSSGRLWSASPALKKPWKGLWNPVVRGTWKRIVVLWAFAPTPEPYRFSSGSKVPFRNNCCCFVSVSLYSSLSAFILWCTFMYERIFLGSFCWDYLGASTFIIRSRKAGRLICSFHFGPSQSQSWIQMCRKSTHKIFESVAFVFYLLLIIELHAESNA